MFGPLFSFSNFKIQCITICNPTLNCMLGDRLPKTYPQPQFPPPILDTPYVLSCIDYSIFRSVPLLQTFGFFHIDPFSVCSVSAFSLRPPYAPPPNRYTIFLLTTLFGPPVTLPGKWCTLLPSFSRSWHLFLAVLPFSVPAPLINLLGPKWYCLEI